MISRNISGYRPTITTNQTNWQNVSPVIQNFDSLNNVERLSPNTGEASSRIRRAAPVDHSAASGALVTAAEKTAIAEQLNDLPVEPGSLIAARVIAARRLLGEESIGRDDEEMLELANQVHKNAQESPNNQVAVDLSSALYAQECAVWGEQNNADKFGVTTETVAQAYQQAWSVMLNPPPLPHFKTRKELAAEDITARNLEAPFYFEEFPTSAKTGKVRISKEDHIALHADESEIVQKYYAQFSDYINQHVDRLCEMKLASLMQTAGLGLFTKDYRFEQVNVVRQLQNSSTPTPLGSANTNILMPQQGWVIPLPEGEYGFAGNDGSFHKLTKPAHSGSGNMWLNLAVSALLRKTQPGPYTILQTRLNTPLSLQEVLAPRIRAHVLATIENWKQEKYDPSTAEMVMRTIVPFYETVHKLRNDPGYQLSFKDVAWDVLDLGITTASIFASAGVLKAAGTGLKAMKAAQSVSSAARVGLGLRTALASVKTGTFLRIAGRELTDFVVPVFTAQSLAKASVRGGATLARSSLSAALRQINMTAAKTTDAAGLLDRIYDSLSQARYVPNALAVKTTLEERAAQTIPSTLFRGQSLRGERDFLASQWGVVESASRDDYLAACIRHASRTGGSAGEVLSLSMDDSVARRFASGRENGRVFTIDAAAQPGNFRTIEDILKNDGPRLVQEGKISAATLAAAIKHAFNQDESEVFYVLGSIPDTLLTIKPPPQSTAQLQKVDRLR